MSKNTKENFIEAFLVLAREQKNLDFSISMLCKKAGYTRATFYSYFQTFEDVLHAINDEVHAECYPEITKFQLKNLNSDNLLDVLLPALYKHRETLRIIYMSGCEYQWTTFTIEKYWSWAKDGIISLTQNTVVKHPELFFSLLLKQIQSIIYNWLIYDFAEKPKEVKERFQFFLTHSFTQLTDFSEGTVMK
ncbi:MAG: TetR/AcrR family transcriptional regulator [Streptococcaceae bacterium]|jgi:AcrR family transcriptional regulator|nr:TetR/AcrR family transcriptional regulator [Streptococcaceae bacterium]